MRWPGVIPAGTTCDQIGTTMDLLPTLARQVRAEFPADRVIDGRDIWPLMVGEQGAMSPHEAFFYYAGQELQAVRSGDWKLHFAHRYLTVFAEPGKSGYPSGFGRLEPKSITSSGLEGIASRHGYRVDDLPKSLYNLRRDPGETENVIDRHPDVVARLEQLAEHIRAQLGDALTGTQGTAVRPRATIFNPDDSRLLIPQPTRPGQAADYVRPE
jgi:arylsulfatase